MTVAIEVGEGRRDPAIVDDASKDSFPASDPPAFTPTSTLGPPATDAEPVPLPEPPPLVEVQEHPVSDPARRQEVCPT